MSNKIKLAIIYAMLATGLVLLSWYAFSFTVPAAHDVTPVSMSATAAKVLESQGPTAAEVQQCHDVGCAQLLSAQAEIASSMIVAHFIGRNWMLFVGLLLSFIGGISLWVRHDNLKNPSAPKQFNPKEVLVNGKKVTIPALKCQRATLILPGDPRLTGLSFDKIIGQLEAKNEILEVLDMLQNVEKYSQMEADLIKGVLMVGPPGVGKTLMVRAIAALCGIPVIEIIGSDFVEKFVGVGSSRVNLLFADGDAIAEIFGAVLIFIDECDALLRHRGSANGNDERETTLNQFLGEMDGVIPRPNMVLFGATNRLDIIDPAALRPGRFDRQVEFFNPNNDEREKMLALYVPEHLRAPDLSFKAAARASVSASGAHLKAIANEAKLGAVRARVNKITLQLLDDASQRVLHGLARQSQRTVLNAIEIVTVKVHEGGHAFVYWKRTGKAPLRVTLIPRGHSGGHVQYSEDFELLKTKEHLLTRLVVAMGGWAGTYIMLDGQEDSGIAADFQMATETALQMVTELGMSKLGKINLPVLSKAGLVSDALKERIVAEVEHLLEWALTEAYNLIALNLDEYHLLIDALQNQETILEHEFPAVFNNNAERPAKVISINIPPPPSIQKAAPRHFEVIEGGRKAHAHHVAKALVALLGLNIEEEQEKPATAHSD